MIVVKLFGGLGNQLFQYAFGRQLSLLKNTELFLDISYYKSQNLRNFELDFFNLNYTIALSKHINRAKQEDSNLNLLRRKIRTFTFPYYKRTFIEEVEKFKFDRNLSNAVPPIYVEGYWQSYKYFENIKTILLNDFSIKETYLSKSSLNYFSTNNMNSYNVSVHIRRGDYVSDKTTHEVHGVLGEKYYMDAMEYLNNVLEKPRFFVFSDDIIWCSENFKNTRFNIEFVDFTKNSIEDFYLMQQCQHNIIANSSFSWWAAYLNTNVNKIVISPKQWLANTNVDTSDLIPAEWIKI